MRVRRTIVTSFAAATARAFRVSILWLLMSAWALSVHLSGPSRVTLWLEELIPRRLTWRDRGR